MGYVSLTIYYYRIHYKEQKIMPDKSKECVNKIDDYLKKLFPFTRSIIEAGYREILEIPQILVLFNIKEYHSGTFVNDSHLFHSCVLKYNKNHA